MSWKAALYGTRDASSIVVTNIFGVIVLVGVYGWWADFVPSPEWADIGFYVAIAATVILSSIYYLALLKGRAKLQPKTSRPVKVFALIGMPFLLFGLLFLAVTHCIGDIATQLIGHEVQLMAELTKQREYSRTGCSYRLKGDALERALLNRLCISEREFSAFPRTGIYELKATQTKLGVHIKSATLSTNR